MAVIHAGWLAPGGQWDTNLIAELLANRLYPTGLEFKSVLGYPNSHGCVLVIPGRYWSDHTDQISEALATYEWALCIRTSDEENWFDIAKIRHPNIKFWVQYPRTDCDYGDARFIGAGFPAHFNNLPQNPPGKTTELFLSAQNTHVRRHEAFAALDERDRWCVQETAGFTQGLDPVSYATLMTAAKVAPAPSGAQSPDSFRVWEALQAHAVPIADDISPVYDSEGFWRRLLPDAPFPIFTDYAEFPALIDAALAGWPAHANRIAAWWIRQKRRYGQWLREDLEKLGAL